MAIHDLLKPRTGLRVPVTGGGAGIGAAIAGAFTAAGGAVFVCDIDPRAVAETDARRDGISGPTGRIEDLDPRHWEDTVSTNLNSQLYVLRAAVPHLRRSEAASIVALSSVAGRLGYAFRTPYASTKWAIVGLMKSLAIELGPDGVRVNAILPGVVDGPRMERVIAERARATGTSAAAMTDSYLSKISLRRMVTMDDVAALALFLCSPAAANITGQAISVDGNVEHL